MAELGPTVVGVTLGAGGYVAIADGVEIESPAYAVDTVDTTGCGDVFHAGYLLGSAAAFRVRNLQLYQIVLRRAGRASPTYVAAR